MITKFYFYSSVVSKVTGWPSRDISDANSVFYFLAVYMYNKYCTFRSVFIIFRKHSLHLQRHDLSFNILLVSRSALGTKLQINMEVCMSRKSFIESNKHTPAGQAACSARTIRSANILLLTVDFHIVHINWNRLGAFTIFSPLIFTTSGC